MSSKVSFTIRRPSPVSRAASSGPDSDVASSGPDSDAASFFKIPPLPHHILSNDDPALGSHIINSLNGEKKDKKPLVITALKNKDWRELARKRRNGSQYIPPSAAAGTGKDGSVGGLGTKDSINSGPVLSGLQVKQKVVSVLERPNIVKDVQDVDELPDVATLEDYDRVPVSQFGAALLRGMGWKEGTAATRIPGKGLIEPYLPSARPALLGIGAKEQEVYDDGSKKGSKPKLPDRRYIPIVKQERSDTPSNGMRDRSRSPRRPSTAISSRYSSRSPNRYSGRSERGEDSRRRESTYGDRSNRKRDHSRESSRRK